MQVIYLILSIFLNSVLVSSGSTPATVQWTPNEFTDNDFALMRAADGMVIRLGDSREFVEERLGAPIGTFGYNYSYEYKGFKIHYRDGVADAMFIDRSTTAKELFQTVRQVTIGDQMEEVMAKYGEPVILSEDDRVTTASYYMERHNGSYRIVHKLTKANNPDNMFTFNLQFDEEERLELIVFSEYRFFIPAKGK